LRPASSKQRGLLARFVEERQSRARYVFARSDLEGLGLSTSAEYASLQRLARAGRISKVGNRHGLWLIVPLEYREVGAPPATWVLDDVMSALGVPYYVGLRSAAEWLGATHHALQTMQVVVGRQLRPFSIGRERLHFVEKRAAATTPITLQPSQVSPLRVSTPGATALDLVRFMDASGGLTTVVGVLEQIADHCTVQDLRLALDAAGDNPSAQRLGYLFARLERRRLAATVAAWLGPRRTRFVPLELGQSRANPIHVGGTTVVDAMWRVTVASELDSSL
jgi:predicted transcriptional regulator of viral defense system